MRLSLSGPNLLKRLKPLDSAHFCAALVALVYAAFILVRLNVLGGPTAFIVAGDRFVNAAEAQPGLIIHPHGAGYDGQFYYRLALNPFDHHLTAYGVTLDKPAYRQQRILYPLLAWLLAFGQPPLVPITLILVNYAALIALAFIAGRYAQALGRSALWGLAAPLYPGFVLSLANDLAEPLAGLLLVTALLFAHRKRFGVATVALSLAILTRETMLLVALALGALWAAGWLSRWLSRWWHDSTPKTWRRLPDRWSERWSERWASAPRIPWQYALVPLAVFACWQGILFVEWGHLAYTNGAGNLGVPFGGFARLLGQVAALSSTRQRYLYAEQLLILVYAVLVACSLRVSRAARYQRLAWALTATLGACLTTLVWVDDWAFLRALTEFFLLGAFILIAGRRRVALTAFALTTALCLFLLVTRAAAI